MFLKSKLGVIPTVFLMLTLVVSCKNKDFELKEGDILFQDLDKENINSAIKKVTKTALDYNFTHVGIVVEGEGGLQVLEAVSAGVQLTSVEDFLNRNLINGKPKVVVGRLNPEFNSNIKRAIEHGKTLVGLSYDSIYIIGDNNYYCSELLYEMFRFVDSETIPFKLKPMTFVDPITNQTLEFWENYYKKLNHKVPEGELGLNPNGMAISPNISLVYDYYRGGNID